MTWAEFKSAVRALLPIENVRVGVGFQDSSGTEGFLTKTIRQAVIDVQNFVPRYRDNHENIYLPEDFVTEGAASRAVLPQPCIFRDAWYWVDETSTRYPLLHFPYSRRFEMVNDQMVLVDNQGRISIDPNEYTFYVFPEVTAGKRVSLFYDGIIKTDFEDGEKTPFDEQLAGVVADYCKSKTSREVEKDMAAYRSYYESYLSGRRKLYLRSK